MSEAESSGGETGRGVDVSKQFVNSGSLNSISFFPPSPVRDEDARVLLAVQPNFYGTGIYFS